MFSLKNKPLTYWRYTNHFHTQSREGA